MTDDGWWDLRKGSTFVYIECGGTHATLHTTDIRMRKGPPVTVDLSLEKNLRSRNTQVGTYIDAQALAAGAIRGLTRLEVSDDHALAGLEHHLKHTQDAAPVALDLESEGPTRFTVEPEPGRRTLVLRVVGALGR